MWTGWQQRVCAYPARHALVAVLQLFADCGQVHGDIVQVFSVGVEVPQYALITHADLDATSYNESSAFEYGQGLAHLPFHVNHGPQSMSVQAHC